jgi:4-alpha-glucanotransferase
MPFSRASGILLHPTSLPSQYGIGDFGPAAYHFIDWLSAAKQHLWQVLPLGPTGYGDSPYQCFSAFAGNPLLISPEFLAQDGLLDQTALESLRTPFGPVDYGRIIPAKFDLLYRAYQAWKQQTESDDYRAFVESERRWLEDYALFMALKNHFGGASWPNWPSELALRNPEAIERAKQEHADAIGYYSFLQYQFAKQWQALRTYAHQRKINIIGDIPIFVAYDSADVWAQPAIFDLKADGTPNAVAGVPPDYFSATGQLWGNPLYRWDVLAQRGFDWWIDRVASTLKLVDIARIDHFRGFAAYWAVPSGESTAINGQWVPAPGFELFEALRAALGDLPIIAEDLGLITDDVYQLRDHFGLPGMRVLQFAFADESATNFLPHNYTPNSVAYPGTHDNDTVVGWFQKASPEERNRALRYTGTDGSAIHWDFIRWLFASVANSVIVPLQDVLGLGDEARMNMPSTTGGNWSWRYQPSDLTPELAARLAELSYTYERTPRTSSAPSA